MNDKFLALLRVANLVKIEFGASSYEVYPYYDGAYSVLFRFRKSLRLSKLSIVIGDFPALVYAEDDLMIVRIDSKE